MLELNKTYQLDARVGLRQLDDESIDCIITSPPYWGLRDYGLEPQTWDGDCCPERDLCTHCNAWRGSLGLEPTFQLYIQHLKQIFTEVKRVLKKTGTCFVNLGDSYSGGGQGGSGIRGKQVSECGMKQIKASVPTKSLCLIPERFAIMMVDDGWILRNKIIWWKRNCMPSSAKDRFTVDFEDVFFFSKQGKYWFEQQFEAIKMISIERSRRGNNENKYSKDEYFPEGVHANTMSQPRDFKGYDGAIEEHENHQGRNKRCVWDITTKSFPEAHFAVFPEKLVEPMILAGCPEGGIVLDPFMGSCTVGKVALRFKRNFIGFDLGYEDISGKRVKDVQLEIYT